MKLQVKYLKLTCLILLLSLPSKGFTSDPWPGESWTSATNLTHLDAEFQADLSGAYWNPVSRTLWVCQNGLAKVWALVEDGSGSFMIREDGAGALYEWDLGTQDLEDLTQVDTASDIVFIINESNGTIQCFDLSSPGAQPLLHSWNVSADLPAYSGGMGPEGLCFVPDAWLEARQFQDQNGVEYYSQMGMAGLMFIAHQQEGMIYVFDLDPDTDNSYLFVGQYRTSRQESCALSFDGDLGILYIWHNIGSNYLEVTDLSSSGYSGLIRQLNTVQEFDAPVTGNLEGFTAAPATGPNHETWCFITCDDCGNDSLRWFQSFSYPDLPTPSSTPAITPPPTPSQTPGQTEPPPPIPSTNDAGTILLILLLSLLVSAVPHRQFH